MAGNVRLIDSANINAVGDVTAAPVANTVLDRLKTINTSIGTPLQAGGTVILGAGSAIAAKVGIDQTTPGTTNLVSAGQNGTWTVQPGNTPNTTAWLVGSNDDDYETVAASQTDQVLGATGATGDKLTGVLITPATTSPGAVSIKDGAGSAITIFVGGASSVSNLVPFFVPLGNGIVSLAGAWKVTTGANVTVIGVGKFT